MGTTPRTDDVYHAEQVEQCPFAQKRSRLGKAMPGVWFVVDGGHFFVTLGVWFAVGVGHFLVTIQKPSLRPIFARKLLSPPVPSITEQLSRHNSLLLPVLQRLLPQHGVPVCTSFYEFKTAIASNRVVLLWRFCGMRSLNQTTITPRAIGTETPASNTFHHTVGPLLTAPEPFLSCFRRGQPNGNHDADAGRASSRGAPEHARLQSCLLGLWWSVEICLVPK